MNESILFSSRGPDATAEDATATVYSMAEDTTAELFKNGWTIRRSFSKMGGRYGGAFQKWVNNTVEPLDTHIVVLLLKHRTT